MSETAKTPIDIYHPLDGLKTIDETTNDEVCEPPDVTVNITGNSGHSKVKIWRGPNPTVEFIANLNPDSLKSEVVTPYDDITFISQQIGSLILRQVSYKEVETED